MTPRQLIRLECLKLAAAIPSSDRGGARLAALAGEFETFVRGDDKAEAPSPAEQTKAQDKGRVGRA